MVSGVRINGRRGAFLLLLGVMHVVLGSSYVFPETTSAVARSVGFLLVWGIPVWVAGIPWMLSGLAAARAALIEAPPGRDGWGFQVLAAVETAWAGVYLFSWLLGSYERGWTWAVVFGALAGAVQIVAGMNDPAADLRRLERGAR